MRWALGYPTDDMSWDELKDLATKTTNEYHYGFISQNIGNICYQDFIYSNGGRFLQKIISDVR